MPFVAFVIILFPMFSETSKIKYDAKGRQLEKFQKGRGIFEEILKRATFRRAKEASSRNLGKNYLSH